ncbi:hypothetical protein [Roseovarius sp. D22-M7]|uniref:hypothetical protein n=1 Tax=Roseovarius sp. D22-M7 TaxID=3127116 RepID=UPI0030104A01
MILKAAKEFCPVLVLCVQRTVTAASHAWKPDRVYVRRLYSTERPLSPWSQDGMRKYADLFLADFEAKIVDVLADFLCPETERARALLEARKLREDHGKFFRALK